MCRDAQQRFTADLTAPASARRFTRDALAAATVAPESPAIDDAEQITGELVINAVHAGAQTVEVRIEIHYDHARISVIDDGTGWPTLRTPRPHDSSGRGLQIVAALATTWGVTIPEDRRTNVWASLRCDPLDTTAVPCQLRSPTSDTVSD